MPAMTPEIAIVLGLLVLAMGLFVTEWLSVDIVALSLLAALIGTGVLSAPQAFASFGSEIVIILASIMILAAAVVKAGVMDWLGQAAYGVAKGNTWLSMLAILAIAAGSSAFLSNTTTTAILMPAAIETARRAQISASRILMPVAFATMLGGSCTLIGTSANLASGGIIARLGLAPFGLFEFARVGLAITVLGLAWLLLAARFVLPERRPPDLDHEHEPRNFFTTLRLPEGSAAVGKAIGEVDFDALETDALAVVRDGARLGAHPLRKLRAGDEVIVRLSRDGFLRMRKSKDFVLDPDLQFSERHGPDVRTVMTEAVITPTSRLVGRSVKRLAFFDRYGGVVLAVYRRGQSRPARIENLILRPGDLLLLQVSERDVPALRHDPNLRILGRVEDTVLTRREGLTTLAAMAAAILVGATGLLPFSMAILLAVLAIVIAGNITMAEAYGFIEWRLLVLIAAMSSFGLAMEQSGAASYLAAYVVAFTKPLGPVAALATFSLLTIALTQPMSNAAAALTVLPIAVASAGDLGFDPRMLAVLVTLSASLSFIAPFEPACLLVYDAGHYRMLDFVRAGLPLTLICVAVLVTAVPILWG